MGVFDPQEQLPPTLYRVRVRGQASVLSNVKYASGWVPASLVDTLNSNLTLDPNADGWVNTNSGDAATGSLTSGRRLMLFGPEGFREAPGDQRLAIVMGQSPQKFFDAVNEALGTIGEAKIDKAGKEEQELFASLIRDLRHDSDRLEDLEDDLAHEVEQLLGEAN